MKDDNDLAKSLVKKGAKLLDQKIPYWYDKIDLDSLVMGSACKCVLGQIGGNPVNLDRLSWDEEKLCIDKDETVDYFGMIDILGLPDGPNYGFNDGYVERDYVNYGSLFFAWKKEILTRRSANAV